MPSTSYFLIESETAASGRYHATAHTGGPWSPQLQHGGPPNALIVEVAERLAVAETGRNDLVSTRLASEFVGPVPVADVLVSARIVRHARSAVLVAAELQSGDRLCLQARVWLTAISDTSAVAVPGEGPGEIAGPDLGARFPYADTIEWRVVHGAFGQPGPACVWARPRMTLIEGRPLTGLARAVLIGDSASGISAELDWSTWSFLNVDLDVHLARQPVGEWVRMDAVTLLGPSGTGMARSLLGDADGPVGATLQTLLLVPRSR